MMNINASGVGANIRCAVADEMFVSVSLGGSKFILYVEVIFTSISVLSLGCMESGSEVVYHI